MKKSPTTNYHLPPTELLQPRVALVTDWIYGGGGELVVEEVHHIYPDAPIYTSYCSDEWRRRLDNKVITGYLQNFPFKQLRKFLPLLRQFWFRRLNLNDFDLVISITGNGEAKFIRTKDTALHVSYCHTPVHFYWRHYDEYIKNPSFRPKWLVRISLKLLVRPLRKRDHEAAQNVDYFIANSSHIQADIKTFYGKASVVIPPPVDTTRFPQLPTTNSQLPESRKGFITAGRLVPYKHVDIVIGACNELKLPLTVIGRGPEHEKLVALAGESVTFRESVSDSEMPGLFASAEAFLFAAYEDFGVTPVEALAAGTPVLAYKQGGALDYVQPGINGEFFDVQSVPSLCTALKKFEPSKLSEEAIRKSALGFSQQSFRKRFENFVSQLSGRQSP